MDISKFKPYDNHKDPTERLPKEDPSPRGVGDNNRGSFEPHQMVNKVFQNPEENFTERDIGLSRMINPMIHAGLTQHEKQGSVPFNIDDSTYHY